MTSVSMDRARDKYAVSAIRVAIVTIGLGLWQLGSSTNLLPPTAVPAPNGVAQVIYGWVQSGSIWGDLGATIFELVVGVVVGTVAGTIVALVLAYVPPLAVALRPMLVAVNGLPRAAVAPLFLLWFGIGYTTQIMLAALLIFFHAFLTTYEGLLSVEDRLVDHVALLGASKGDLLKRLYLPATAYWVASSLKVSVGLGFLGVIVGEYLGATQGLGYQLAAGRGFGDLTYAFAALVLIAIVAGTATVVVGRISARFETKTL